MDVLTLWLGSLISVKILGRMLVLSTELGVIIVLLLLPWYDTLLYPRALRTIRTLSCRAIMFRGWELVNTIYKHERVLMLITCLHRGYLDSALARWRPERSMCGLLSARLLGIGTLLLQNPSCHLTQILRVCTRLPIQILAFPLLHDLDLIASKVDKAIFGGILTEQALLFYYHIFSWAWLKLLRHKYHVLLKRTVMSNSWIKDDTCEWSLSIIPLIIDCIVTIVWVHHLRLLVQLL